jgi:hypothetical protein
MVTKILYYYYSNHVNEISYFLRRQMYIKTFLGSQPEDGFIKKSRNMSLLIFLYF